MEDWIKEGKGEEWWDTEAGKWDWVYKDEFDEEKKKRVELAKILIEMGEVNDQNMLILEQRLNSEGCHCEDRKRKENKRRVEELSDSESEKDGPAKSAKQPKTISKGKILLFIMEIIF